METAPAQAHEAAPPAATPPAQSNPATETAPAAPVAPAVANTQSDPALPMDFDSIDRLFTGEGSLDVPNSAVSGGTEEPSSAPQPAAPEPTVQPQGDTPAEPAEGDPAQPTADDRILPNRIPTKNLETPVQVALRMQHDLNAGKNPGESGYVTFDDCYARAKELSTPAPTPAPEPAAPSEVDSFKGRVEEVRGRLADLRQQRAEMQGYGSDTSELDAEITAATEALTDAQVDFKFAQRQAESDQANRAATEAERQADARAKAKADVVKEFPAVAKPGTSLHAAVQQVVTEYQQPSHPDNALLFATNAARHILREALSRVAEQEGISYSTAWDKYRAAPSAPGTAPAPSAPPSTEPAQRRVMPASGAFTTTPPAAARTESELLADVGSDPDKLDEALGYKDSGFHYIT